MFASLPLAALLLQLLQAPSKFLFILGSLIKLPFQLKIKVEVEEELAPLEVALF